MPKLKHEGLHTYRLTTDADNPREQIFAGLWAEEQNVRTGRPAPLLAHLIQTEDNPQGNISQRDATVAATIIQWLGTNVGQSFLRKAEENIRARGSKA